MKTKSTLKIWSLLLFSFCLLSFSAKAQTETIVQWNGYTQGSPPADNGSFLAKEGLAINKDIAELSRAGGSTGYKFAVNADKVAASTNKWDAAGEEYWIASFSTTGYENLTLTSKQLGSNTGPTNFKIQYKVGAGAWTDLTGAENIIVKNDNYASGKVENLSLPVGMADQSAVSLRWLRTSLTSINGSTVGSGGVNRLDVTVMGEPKGGIVLSTDATLSDLSVDGLSITGFTSSKLNYRYVLPEGTVIIPVVTATKNDANATMVITQAGVLPGIATVSVTAENTSYVNEYTVEFTFSKNDGSINFPYTVEEAKQLQDGNNYWVMGYIVGSVADNTGALISDPLEFVNTNIALGSDSLGTTYMSVQLPAGSIRNALNLVDNGTNIAKPVLIYGKLGEYCKIPGIRETSNYQFITGPLIKVTPSPVVDLVRGKTITLKVSGQALTQPIQISVDDNTKVGISQNSLPFDADQVEIVLTGLALGTTYVTFKSGTDAEAKVKVTVVLSKDPTLSDLQVDGVQIAGFIPSKLTYRYVLAEGTVIVPVITATVNDAGKASMQIIPASGLPGTTIVRVTAEDPTYVNEYKVEFTFSKNDGSKDHPFTVEEAKQIQDGNKYWVMGYIVGCVNTSNGSLINELPKFVNTNFALGSDPSGTTHMSAQLPSGAVRSAINVVDNIANIGKPVLIYGNFEKYCGIAGVRNTSDYQFITGPLITVTPSPVTDLLVEHSIKLKVTAQALTQAIDISVDDNTKASVSLASLPNDANQAEVILNAKATGTTYVTFKSGTDVESKVKVTIIPLSSDATLKTLKIGSETISLSSSYVYTAKPVSFNTKTVTITATPTHKNARVIRGLETYNLSIGENAFDIWIQAEDHSIRAYTVYLTRNCAVPVISQQLQANISACESKKYTLEVKTTGDDLNYQWFFEDKEIEGATARTHTFANLQESDYGRYHVAVSGACGTPVISEESRLWIAKPLPNPLLLTAPDTVYVGQRYKVSVGYDYGYPDVTNYSWSFSNANADFYSSVGNNSPVMYVTFGPQAVNGTLKVSLSHVCGAQSVSKPVKVFVPTDIDNVDNDNLRLYPNPVVDILIIDNNQMTIESLTVSDVNGRVIYNSELQVSSYELSTVNWLTGIYFVTVKTTKGIKTYKVVKK